MKSCVYIEHQSEARYPKWNENQFYNPSVNFPEYKMSGLGKENYVYTMIRDIFESLSLDKTNYGKPNWNPLGEFINPGDVVLVKPNMVKDLNENNNFGTDCLITHPSIVRTVVDYILIALKGSGRVIIADAPVQSCNFENLISKLHYTDIIRYYADQGHKIELLDLRESGRQFSNNKKTYLPNKINNKTLNLQTSSIAVDLGKDSAFGNYDRKNSLRITNYVADDMLTYHNNYEQSYVIAKVALEANVIINLPKPKTHRKAGITGALKNMIGCVAKKESLPHHTKGSKEELGDEYLHKSVLKDIATNINEKQDKYIVKKNRNSAILNFEGKIISGLLKFLKKDNFQEGSWYGNDTIWRTICDINRIILYADSNGMLKDTPQRKTFTLCDMIIAGDGEGPLLPSPVKLGMLIAGDDSIAIDKTIAAIMGFNFNLIPSINNATFGRRYKLPLKSFIVESNNLIFNLKELMEIKNTAKPFEPSSGWKGHIGV